MVSMLIVSTEISSPLSSSLKSPVLLKDRHNYESFFFHFYFQDKLLRSIHSPLFDSIIDFEDIYNEYGLKGRFFFPTLPLLKTRSGSVFSIEQRKMKRMIISS